MMREFGSFKGREGNGDLGTNKAIRNIITGGSKKGKYGKKKKENIFKKIIKELNIFFSPQYGML